MKVAVISAFNPRNAGMYSVDLAAVDFLTRHNIEHTLFITQSHKKKEYHSFGRFLFCVIRNLDLIERFSHVLYWGDFLNNPMYGATDFTVREIRFGYSNTISDSFENWLRLYLLDGIQNRSFKTISVSNNFQDLSGNFSDSINHRIAELLSRNFDAIYPRDEVSLRTLREHYPDAARGRMQCGIDAAFLLRPESIVRRRSKHADSGYFCYFFARSDIENTDALVQQIASKTGLRAVRLRHWLSMVPWLSDWQYRQSLKTIRDARFVVSDTYHCCVNAMNIERPVIGLGRAECGQKGTLGDFKKAELFRMHDLSSLYCTVTSPNVSATEIREIMDKAHAIIDDPAQLTRNFATLRRQKAEYEALLLDTITKDARD